MAKPIYFPQANARYTADGCEDLPILNNKNEKISCWQLSPDELKTVAETGVIWLSCLGSQPPVYIACEQPFEVVANADS